MDALPFRLIALVVSAGLCATVAAQTPRDSATISPAQKLVREFDLVPKLLSKSKGQSDGSPLRTIARRMTVIHQDLSQLQTLEVLGTKVTDAGVKDLQKALPNCKIVR